MKASIRTQFHSTWCSRVHCKAVHLREPWVEGKAWPNPIEDLQQSLLKKGQIIVQPDDGEQDQGPVTNAAGLHRRLPVTRKSGALALEHVRAYVRDTGRRVALFDGAAL